MSFSWPKGYSENLPVNHRHGIYPTIDPEEAWKAQTFTGKVVLVVGASRGIGQTVALFYAKAGASVAIAGRHQVTLDKTKEMILNEKGDAQVMTCCVDVKDSGAARVSVESVIRNWQRLDILVANSGATNAFDKTMVERDAEDWWEVFTVNVKGVYNFIRAGSPHLEKTGGYLVVMSSIGAQLRTPLGSEYNISKHTLNRLVEYVVQESPQIRGSFALHPGSVRTELLKTSKLEELGAPADDPPELAAAVVLYLTSGKADWLNGRYVDASWDFDEVERNWKDKILTEDLLINKLAV
ncbi:NAD-P-binding protein [Peniophora sp. CONT]|nr:NAD-P-binding protein [Peniophora sp. CONT]